MDIELTARCVTPEACPFSAGTFCGNPLCAIETDEVDLPCSVTAHEKKLRTLACCVSGRKPVSLHHVRGGSIAVTPFGSPGASQKQNPALQIPLHPEFHYASKQGIDAQVGGGVQSWEARHGLQTHHLASTSHLLRYSLWSLAWQWASPLVRGRVERFLRQSRSRYHPQ